MRDSLISSWFFLNLFLALGLSTFIEFKLEPTGVLSPLGAGISGGTRDVYDPYDEFGFMSCEFLEFGLELVAGCLGFLDGLFD